MAEWKLTVRHGSKVDQERFGELEAAVAAMRRWALQIRAAGPARPVSALRDFSPASQVLARLQLSEGRLLRRNTAGVDVRGDGTFVAFRGRLRREELDPTHHDTPFDTVRETLEKAR